MTRTRALLLALASFVVFGAIVVLIFLALDVDTVLLPGPLAGVAIACFYAYRTARQDGG